MRRRRRWIVVWGALCLPLSVFSCVWIILQLQGGLFTARLGYCLLIVLGGGLPLLLILLAIIGLLPGTDRPVAIFVPLAGGPEDGFAPVEAIRLRGDIYRIISLNPAPDKEPWEFWTGEIVRCEERLVLGRGGLVAVQRVCRGAL